MKRVLQTRFYSDTTKGNCQQAAVASILGVPLEEIPDFHSYENFWHGFRTYMRLRGYAILVTTQDVADELGCFYLAYGMSLRGVRHACIYRLGELAHDPHPSCEGFVSVDEVNVLVPLEIKQ